MMKIAVTYTGLFPPLKGASGGDRRVRDLTLGLCQDGNEVTMYVPIWQDKGQENNDKAAYTIHYIGSNNLGKIPFINRFSFWLSLVKHTKLAKIEAVLFYGPLIDTLLATFLLRREKTFLALETCDLQSSTNKDTFFQTILLWLYRKGEECVPKTVHLNIIISKHLDDFVKKHAPNVPTLTIPILVDNETFKPSEEKRNQFRKDNNIAANEIVIAYVGGMWEIEGVHFLLEAFRDIKLKTDKKIRLVIAGSLEKKVSCTDVLGLIEQFNLQNYVITTGWVGTEVVTQILNAADILTVPQGQDEFNKAGLPTKLAEYSAIGKAIVVSQIGDVDVYFTDGVNALLTEPSNVSSLSNALLTLIENDILRAELSENARKLSFEKFNYKVNGKLILDKMKTLLEKRIK